VCVCVRWRIVELFTIEFLQSHLRSSFPYQCSVVTSRMSLSQIESLCSLQLVFPKPIGEYWNLIINCWCEWKSGCKFVVFCSGSLSPENLQKYSMEALNTTQVYAVWTYDWVWQKVQTLSKIQ